MIENISYAVFWNSKDSENEFQTSWFTLHEEAQERYDRISKCPNARNVRMVRRVEQLEVVQKDW